MSFVYGLAVYLVLCYVAIGVFYRLQKEEVDAAEVFGCVMFAPIMGPVCASIVIMVLGYELVEKFTDRLIRRNDG